jgi:ferrous iron transport protein B
VADATNLRLVLRLILELKAVGRPMVLALNMYDIAQRQGLRIDLEGLRRDLGCPIVTTVATRKRGIEELTAQVDALIASGALATANTWHEPSAGEIRGAHREAQRMLKATCARPSGRTPHRQGRRGAAAPGGRAWPILFGLLFVMFQAVFTWATPAQDAMTPASSGWARSPARTARRPLEELHLRRVIAGCGSVLVFLPQILVLFFFIILPEDFGYMARAAFLMDRIMGGAGLHGRAFIPLLSSFACADPGNYVDAGDRQQTRPADHHPWWRP